MSVWYRDEYGFAVEKELSLHQIEMMLENGHRIYASATGVVREEGIQATVFEYFRAEPLYDSQEALERGGINGLAPTGLAADYRIECLDGNLLRPPLSLAMAQRRGLFTAGDPEIAPTSGQRIYPDTKDYIDDKQQRESDRAVP